MTKEPDPFGNMSAQGNLFGDGANRMAPPQRTTTPDPETIRLRLSKLVETVRAAEAMPWSERDARMWQIVLPNMTKWLPQKEAASFREAFDREMQRLESVGLS
jgi:hypothetical protein